MASHAALLHELKSAPRARFYLCDLHVHSPASPDVRSGERFDRLSPAERQLLDQVPAHTAKQPGDYEAHVQSAFPVSRYHELLVQRRDEVARQEAIPPGEDWAFVAITDHNVCEYATALATYAWEQRDTSRLVVLPGLELDVAFPVHGEEKTSAHLLLIFAPGTKASDIRLAVCGSTAGVWNCGKTAEVASLPDFVAGLRKHPEYPAIVIAAHVSSSKGVREAATGTEEDAFTALDAAIARTLAELERNPEADKNALASRLEQLRNDRAQKAAQISEQVLKLIGACGFDGLQVSWKQDETHYRRLHRFHPDFGRAVPLVASDAHRLAEVFACEGNIPYLKVPSQSSAVTAEQTLLGIRHALRYGETRFSYCSPGQVTRWISGLAITPDAPKASRFWPFAPEGNTQGSFVLPLSRNLNCLVGGRGSGKSALLEALAFVTDPAGFQGKHRKKEDDLEDWYKRARATLAGCQVQLVWQTAGGTAELPKGALFVSRYFKPEGEHGPVGYSTVEGKEVLGSAVDLETPQLFRTREIESAAEPARLRQLFDRLVGKQIPALEADITSLLGQLSAQRGEMVRVATRITDLTQDDTPLREYRRRKAAYEAANRPEVQPFYEQLDQASAAERIAKDAKKQWEQTTKEAAVEDGHARLLRVLDALPARIRDASGQTKPYCDGMARLFTSAPDGQSPRNRLAQASQHMQEEIQAVQGILVGAASTTAAAHQNAREELVRQGLPPGAKDRESKKQDFEQAEKALEEYRTLLGQWQAALQERDFLFERLVAKCKERTELRVATAARLNAQLGRDLDPSILMIQVQVHPTEDRSAFRNWLADTIGPSIPKSKDARISAIVEKGVLPKQVRDSLLGEGPQGASVFTVDRARANEGRVEPALAETIIKQCSGKVRLDPEAAMGEAPSPQEESEHLPPEVQNGLWTFPKAGGNSGDLIVDSVLALDEVVFDDRPEILLNDRPQEQGSALRPIGELSPGQRCSAILPILLLNGRSPLIIDQPEDNLDNRLIRQVIVNILASIKLRRQVIVATHNPNLPVLGDVEQAVVLRAVEERQSHLESTGDLDDPETVAHLTEIMEGGREAFQYRQSIYQAHWTGPIA